MKKYIFSLIFCILIITLSCDNNLTNINDTIKQYIATNELPISIGEEIIVYNDFNINDKINFQLFMLDLLNILTKNISEGNFDDKTIENFIELQRIISGFYNNCVSKNYELSIIFDIIRNENDLLIDYLEYYNYNLTYCNNFVIFDNNTTYIKLKDLIIILLQIEDIARNNLTNYFLLFWNDKNAYVYKKIFFIDGIIETIDSYVFDPFYNESIDIASEVTLMNTCYGLIDSIIYLFKIKDYDLEEYKNIWEELLVKKTGFEIIIDNYNSSR
jgi:hypothetical protein